MLSHRNSNRFCPSKNHLNCFGVEVSFTHDYSCSRISSLLAEQSVRLRENNEAVKYYKEAIKHTPDDISLQVALARLFMQMNGMDQCQQVCDQILQVDSKNEAASVMMADLSFRKVCYMRCYKSLNIC